MQLSISAEDGGAYAMKTAIGRQHEEFARVPSRNPEHLLSETEAEGMIDLRNCPDHTEQRPQYLGEFILVSHSRASIVGDEGIADVIC